MIEKVKHLVEVQKIEATDQWWNINYKNQVDTIDQKNELGEETQVEVETIVAEAWKDRNQGLAQGRGQDTKVDNYP